MSCEVGFEVFMRCVHAGGHLREVGDARQGAEQAAGGVQLPLHLHPQRSEAGGEVCTYSMNLVSIASSHYVALESFQSCHAVAEVPLLSVH